MVYSTLDLICVLNRCISVKLFKNCYTVEYHGFYCVYETASD